MMAFESLGIENTDSAEPRALRFDAIKKAEIGFFPGAIEALRHLRGRGQKMGLVTNGSELLQREKIERFNLEPLFDCIVIEGAYGAGKPDRRVFDFAHETLDVSPAEVWMVGDNLLNDIAGAQAVGIYSTWVDWNNSGIPKDCAAVPDRVIRSIAELID